MSMASHDRNNHIAPNFDFYDLMNAMGLLTVLSASGDDTANGVI